MGRRAIGNTNVGIYDPLSLLIDVAAPYSLDYVRQYTYPTQAQTNANVGDYAQAAGQYLFQIPIRTENAIFGSVSITYPWSETPPGNEDFIGTSRQAYSYNYTYITISATAIYPKVFNYWQTSGLAVYSYSNPLNIAWYDDPITYLSGTGYSLTAKFI
jgi:hypothetical protein